MTDPKARRWAAGARTIATIARPRNNLVALLGDSRFDYGLLQSGGARVLPATFSLVQSIGGWLEILTGQRVQCPPKYNYGVAGYKTDEVIANTLPLAEASPAASVLLLIGTNDRGGANRTLQSSIDNLTIILDRLYAAGKLVFLICELPRDGIDSNADQPYIALQFAEWMRKVAFKRPGVVGVDAWPVMADPAGTVTATRLTANYADGAHLNGAGGYAVAKAAAPAFNTIFPAIDPLIGNNFDLYDATRTPGGNLLTNGMQTGTNGTVGNTGSGTYSGTDVASSWRVDMSASTGITSTLAKSTLTNGSVAQQVTLSGTASSSSASRAVYFTSPNFASSLAEGDVLEAMAQFEAAASPGSYNGFSLEVVLTASGTTTAAILGRDISSNYMPTEAWAGPVRTPQIAVPASLTDARVIVRITYPQSQAQSGVFKFGRLSARKVEPLT